jgi:GNAT superfamily N-acetyltransferase
MKTATINEKQIVVDLLTLSFMDNQSVNYIIRQDERKTKRIRALMDYSYEVCKEFGEVWLSDDEKACALVLYPQSKRTTITSIWLDLKLIFQAIGLNNIQKALHRESKIKKQQPQINMMYIWFIGVDPQHQHLGIGSSILKEVLEKAENENLPTYLETSTLKNLPWYERYGFEIYNRLELGYTLFFLKHEPNK